MSFEQIRVILVNSDSEVLGYEEKYAAHKNPVPLHRAISIVIFDPKKEKMLIQQRAKDKPTWPLFWSNAVCTHPLPDESYQAAAKRRLKEELGFSTPLEEASRFTYQAKYDKTWGEHEYDVVFEGKYKGKVSLNPEEAVDFKWVEIEKLKEDVTENKDKYTPWFRIILEKLKF